MTLSVLLSVLACATIACAQSRDDPASAAGGCTLRVIVGLERAPDEALLVELGRASGTELKLVSSVGANLYVLTLAAAGNDAACAAAMERLRTDPRVRSVDVDARSEIHNP